MNLTHPSVHPASTTAAVRDSGRGEDDVVVVLATGTGARADIAAAEAARLLAATAGAVTTAHVTTPGLDGLLERAAGVYVLDPGRLTAWRNRRRLRRRPGVAALHALSAAGRARTRLTLLGLLADRPGRVRWITTAGQLDQLARDGDPRR